MSKQGPGKRTQAFVAWTLRHGRLIWIIAALLAIPATLRTALLYMHLRSELDQLLPREAASVTAITELRERMPGLSYLGVIVDPGDPAHLKDGERLLDDLAARVRTYPPDLVRAVRVGVTEERSFIQEHAGLFMDLDDLRAVRQRIEARRDYEVNKALDIALDDTPPPPFDLKDIEDKYKQRDPTRGRFPDGRLSSADLRVTLLLIQLDGFSTGAGRAKVLMDRVKADLHDLGAPDRYGPGMRVGFTGDAAISVEETSGLVADLSLSSVLVFFAVAAAIVLYFRWWRSTVALILPLLVGTAYAFAIVSLPPLRITELNSNTAFLGSIIVGNGVNASIILLARYMEERRRGASIEDALVLAIWGTRAATLGVALAAGVAYTSLIVTQFRGFRQFGAIGGVGMLLCWGSAYLLLPPLVAWLDGGKLPASKAEGRLMGPLSRFIARYPAAIAAASLVFTVLSLYPIRGFNMSQLEHDFSRLRRASTWTSGEGFWGRKMDALLDRQLSPTVILADNAEQARAIADDLRAEAREGKPLGERVRSVLTVDDVLPAHQAEKIAELTAIKKMMTPRLLSLVPADRRADVDRLLGDAGRAPLTPADLPAVLTTGMRERDGAFDRVVLIYPRPTKALWQGPPLLAYVDEIRAVAARHPSGGRPARVAGSHPLTADIIRAVERDGPIAAITAFIGVVAVVVAMFRRRPTTLFVLGALLVGVSWFVAATLALGIRVNFTSFIALPITLGIGADYAINFLGRYEQDGGRDIEAAIRGTGGAVGLCSATTIIGYSSLLLADNRALFSFGVTAVLGEITCLTAAIVALPAVLILLYGRLRPRDN